jgi:hypothetical protein
MGNKLNPTQKKPTHWINNTINKIEPTAQYDYYFIWFDDGVLLEYTQTYLFTWFTY